MSFSRFFYLTGSFIIGGFFLLFGVFSILLPWSSALKSATIALISNQSLILSLFGFGFALIGLSIIIYTSIKTHHHSIEIRAGELKITLDENVIRHYLDIYWQKHFPTSVVNFSLNFKKQSLKIVADLPFVPLNHQKEFLEQVKQDFNDLFGRVLGYPYDVHFIASFQTNPNP